MAYIDKYKALNLDFKIQVSLFESRRKTGRHFPELPALLEKMKEVESNDS